MKANELRVGNKVLVIKEGGWNNVGQIITVNEICSKGVNPWTDMGASGCNPFDGIVGVQLTADVLQKVGFVQIYPDQMILEVGKAYYAARPLKNGNWYIDFSYPITELHLFQNVFYFNELSELSFKVNL